MATANPDDLFLINRDDVTYQVKQEDLVATIQPTDHMIINRNDVVYKINGDDVIDSFIPELIFNEVILSDYSPTTLDTISVTLDVQGGQPPYTIEYQWFYKSTAEGISTTLIEGATTPTLYLPDSLANNEVACEVTFTDNRGTSETLTSDFTDPIILKVAPAVLDSVTLTQTSSGTNRFTDETFSAAVALSYEGKPLSTKSLSAYTDGSFTTALETSPIVGVTQEDVNPIQYLSTNDPAGISNAYLIFQKKSKQVFSPMASVSGDYYIQFMFPNPIPWNFQSVYEQQDPDFPPGGFTMNTSQYCKTLVWEVQDDITGPNAWREAWGPSDYDKGATPVCTGYGYYSILSLNTWAKIANSGNVYGFRVRNIAPDVGLKLNYLASTENKYQQGNRQHTDEDKNLIIELAGDTAFDFIEAGDEVTETGTDKKGVVYKKLDNNRLLMRYDSPTDWTPGATLTLPVKPVPGTRFYCVLDEEGNVTDLSPSKPAVVYQTTDENPTMELKFPSVFPGGLTPDEELNEGARLTVEARATNTVGTVGPVTDDIVPGGTTTLTAQQREIQIITSLTTEFRSAQERVSQGEQLRADLLARGYSQASIDAVLGN